MKNASLGAAKNPFLQRLHYFFISDFLQNVVEAVDILPSVQSDHSILKLTNKFSPTDKQIRDPSSWRFSKSLTADKCFVDLMKSEIPTFYEGGVK